MSDARDSWESSEDGLTPRETSAGTARGQHVSRHHEPRHHSYRFLSATVFTILGLLAMAGVKSYRDLASAQDVESALRREISATKARIQALTEHIDRVENDPATLERLAREELGMVREGDIVIVLPEDRESTDDRESAEASLTAAED